VSVVAVGSVAFDSIETPIGRVEKAIGGSATYFSLAASYFMPVNLVAVVGDDFTEDHRAILRDRRIDLSGLTVVKKGKTFFWHGRYGHDPNDRESIVTELNVFDGFRPSLPNTYRNAKWLFLGNIDPEIQLEVIDQMAGRPLVGCDTMNFWIERKPDKLLAVLRRVDVFFINDAEARQLSGNINLIGAARTILGMGPTAVVIKKGEHGAFLFTHNFRVFTPAYPLEEVVDPTGAGDSFAGGFIGYLAKAGGLHELNLRRAMYYGTVTASFTCESFSVGRLKSLTETDIQDRFKALVDLVHVQLE
jgi:sugar/nucleoside kinase (ribokinase family)